MKREKRLEAQNNDIRTLLTNLNDPIMLRTLEVTLRDRSEIDNKNIDDNGRGQDNAGKEEKV